MILTRSAASDFRTALEIVRYESMERPTMSQSPLEVVTEYMAGVKSLDADRCLATMSEDCKLHTPCVPGPIAKFLGGKEEIRPVYVFLYSKVFKEFHIGREILLETSDPEVIVVHASATIPLLSGKPYDNDYVFLIRVRSGKIAELWEFFDTGRAALALGG